MAQSSELSALSGPSLEKAVKELNEPRDPNKRQKLVRDLRERLQTWRPKDHSEDGITFSRLEDDKFLLRFLRAKKFDLSRAEQLYINYHVIRHKNFEVLGEISPQAAERVLDSGMVTVLPHRTKDGCRVMVIRPSRWDRVEIKVEEVLKAVLVVLDRLLEEEETQVHGIAVFENLIGLSLVQVLQLVRSDRSQKKLLLELLQDAFPARFKGVHVVNQPWYISLVMALVLPFIKQKYRERIHMHGTDFTSLYEYIPMEHLPLEFGGQLPSLDSFSAKLLFQEMSEQSIIII